MGKKVLEKALKVVCVYFAFLEMAVLGNNELKWPLRPFPSSIIQLCFVLRT